MGPAANRSIVTRRSLIDIPVCGTFLRLVRTSYLTLRKYLKKDIKRVEQRSTLPARRPAFPGAAELYSATLAAG